VPVTFVCPPYLGDEFIGYVISRILGTEKRLSHHCLILKENRVISCNQCKYWCPMIQVVIVYLEIVTCLMLLPLISDWLRVKEFGVRIRLEREVLNYLPAL
jgi:hypothetical protein